MEHAGAQTTAARGRKHGWWAREEEAPLSRGGTSSWAAAAQALAVSRGHGSAGRGRTVVLNGLVSGRQDDRRVLALCI